MKWRFAALSILVCLVLSALANLPVYPAERNNTGNRLFANQNYETALNAYHVAQVNAPDEAVPYYNASSVLAATGRLRDALETLEQALLNADERLIPTTYYNLGNIYFELARYEDAIAAYYEVLRRTPDDDDARYNYELALSRRTQPTPTLQEQQTNPEENEVDPTVTPSPNPAAQDGPTPTPPPESQPDTQPTQETGFTGDQEGQLQASLTPSTGGGRTIEEVERQLDAIQNNQQTLREALSHAATPAGSDTKDW